MAGWTFKDLLEVTGFEKMSLEYAANVRHTLLVPRSLRFARDENENAPWDSRNPMRPVWTTQGQPTHVLWEGLDLRELPAEATGDCLWDFLLLADFSFPETPWDYWEPDDEWIADLRRFIDKWGLLDYGEDSGPGTISEAWRDFGDWLGAAQEVWSLLVIMSLTEAEELVPEEALEWLRQWIEVPTDVKSPLNRPYPPEGNSLTETRDWLHGNTYAWMKAERKAGRGLALQRQAVVGMLLEIPYPPERRVNLPDEVEGLPMAFAWDESGRRVLTRARGVREILGFQLQARFGSPQLDVFICSVCGRPFPFDESRDQRRPRTGVKRLCSDECRKEAKRESNRASWHKNKARWSSQGSKKVEAKNEPES